MMEVERFQRLQAELNELFAPPPRSGLFGRLRSAVGRIWTGED